VTESAGSIRAMNRERITEAILAAAREQIAADGASGLSLRAIARELKMASSAVYRYFPSRDDLLTQLIIDSYNSLGAAAEEAHGQVAHDDVATRFRAIVGSVRRWALHNRHEYFLIYGTPVPGYRAPQDTVGPATRVSVLLLGLLVDVAAQRQESAPPLPEPVGLRLAIEPIAQFAPPQIPQDLLVVGVGVLSSLLGAVSAELGGQLHNVITETTASRDVFFDALVEHWLSGLGVSH